MLPLFARHSTVGGVPPFTLMQWLGTAFALNRMLHTLALIIACGLWLVIFGFRFRRPPAGATVARLLIAWGVTCILIGNKAAYTHEFIWIFLTPGIAVSTALLIEGLFHFTERYRVAPATGVGVALVVAMFATWTGLRQDWADLVFNFDVQPWDATAAGIVFPRRWDDGFADVRVYLEERYPAVRLPAALSEKFEVFRVPGPAGVPAP